MVPLTSSTRAISTRRFGTAQADGLLVVRYLLGLRGTALTTGVIGANSGRTPAHIATYIQSLLL